MSPFERAMAAELTALLRAGVPVRAVRLTVRELVFARLERAELSSREVSDAVEATVRAACHLVRELEVSSDVVETVCRASLEAVRGHGGESALWLDDATSAAYAVLDELALERPEEPTWRWVALRIPRW